MKLLAHILRIIIMTVIIGAVLYNINTRFRTAVDQKIEWLFPCRSIITYSIDNVDPRFGVTKEQFLSMIKVGEKTWEDAAGKELFDYKLEDGKVSVNLIYDDRQSSTDKLKNLGYIINDDKESFNDLKSKYDALKATFDREKRQIEEDIAELKSDRIAFQKEVDYWNEKGGAPKNEYSRLQKEQNDLNTRAENINERQRKLNESVDTLNSLGTVLNEQINTLNLDVARYNSNQETLGEEFDQGEYRLDENGRSINIYQFDNRAKLERVLTHELGHALGLPHNDNPRSVMYKLNQASTLKLSKDDIASLEATCKI